MEATNLMLGEQNEELEDLVDSFILQQHNLEMQVDTLESKQVIYDFFNVNDVDINIDGALEVDTIAPNVLFDNLCVEPGQNFEVAIQMALQEEVGAASVELAKTLENGLNGVVFATFASSPAELSNISLRHRGPVSDLTEF